jgi:hypothetical protein
MGQPFIPTASRTLSPAQEAILAYLEAGPAIWIRGRERKTWEHQGKRYFESSNGPRANLARAGAIKHDGAPGTWSATPAGLAVLQRVRAAREATRARRGIEA